jgi:hypothetical protein
MQSGDLIEAETFDRKWIRCRFIEIRNGRAIVCGEKEWERAKADSRKPICLGWPLTHVRELENRSVPEASIR